MVCLSNISKNFTAKIAKNAEKTFIQFPILKSIIFVPLLSELNYISPFLCQDYIIFRNVLHPSVLKYRVWGESRTRPYTLNPIRETIEKK
jgi:hypothetical protein